ncbi:hypothetical protein J8I87_13190, partial [Paraburkholderia sp. LEh10]|uniref:hypothetical protein n=1 Tax=Paraburkholderia sp. LEh10 TaxID=2821353 RepID=UPI001AE9E235
STHTYRLLIFKEHSLKGAVLRCFFASSATREANFEPPDTRRQGKLENIFLIMPTSNTSDDTHQD